MNKIYKYIFSVLLIAIFSVYFFSCTSKENSNDDTLDPDSNSPQTDPNIIPQFVNNDYIELSKVRQISKFRSGIGHDYSDDFEKCRSMKHYYQPFDSVNWSSVKIFSPVNGTVERIFDEWAGTQIQIKPDQYPNFTFIIFHVKLLSPLNVGDKVAAGKQIGTHIGSQTFSDIAVVQMIPNNPNNSLRKMISYFDLMTSSLFHNYQSRGINSRNDLVISAAARNADPLNCSGDSFATQGTMDNWTILK